MSEWCINIKMFFSAYSRQV